MTVFAFFTYLLTKFDHASCNQKRTPSALTRRTRGRALQLALAVTRCPTPLRARSGRLVAGRRHCMQLYACSSACSRHGGLARGPRSERSPGTKLCKRIDLPIHGDFVAGSSFVVVQIVESHNLRHRHFERVLQQDCVSRRLRSAIPLPGCGSNLRVQSAPRIQASAQRWRS